MMSDLVLTLLVIPAGLFILWGSTAIDGARRLMRQVGRRRLTLDEAFDVEWRREHERVSDLQKLSWPELRAKCERAYRHPCECATKYEIAKRIYFSEQHTPREPRPLAFPAHEANAEVPE